MKTLPKPARLAVVLLAALLLAGVAGAAEKTRLLVISGGHEFQTNEFYQVFKDNPDVTFETYSHPNAQARLRPDAAKNYDVLVLYDLWPKISEETQADFLDFLKAGKGLVVLAKLLILLMVPFFWEHRVFLLLLTVAVASVGSHMPSRFRHRSFLPAVQQSSDAVRTLSSRSHPG